MEEVQNYGILVSSGFVFQLFSHSQGAKVSFTKLILEKPRVTEPAHLKASISCLF